MRRTVLVLTSSLSAAACSGSEDTADPAGAGGADTTGTSSSTATTTDAPSATSDGETDGRSEPIDPPATIRPGVEQIAVLDAVPGTDVRVLPADLDAPSIDDLDTIDLGGAPGGTVDELGSLLARGLDSGVDAPPTVECRRGPSGRARRVPAGAT